HQWLPESVDVERSFPKNILDSLERKGYAINERGNIGRTEVIKVLPDGKLEAIADNRGDDDARGW
ncbi:MAG: gamma-glutamyltransferase, partial [Chitinophagaceae bacterium]